MFSNMSSMFGAMKLKLYHQPGGQALKLASGGGAIPFFQWQTCLRSLVLVPEDGSDRLVHGAANTEAAGEWLEDELAYKRILEIACGLHSPLVGETEVFGQFKDAIQERIARASVSTSVNSPVSAVEMAFVATLRQWAKALIEDVKLVRQKHLLDLGSQSYGSLVRREVRDFVRPQIEFLGSGQLTAEILPWLLKAWRNDGSVQESATPSVAVHVRDIEKARKRLEETTKEPIAYYSLSHGPRVLAEPASTQAVRVLIIAAPMTADEIAAWGRDRVHYDLAIDLRGESRHDSLRGRGLASQLRELDEVFSSIEAAREVASLKKNAALGLIEQRVEVRSEAALHRPFGWDDVWS